LPALRCSSSQVAALTWPQRLPEDQGPNNQVLVLHLTYYGLDVYHRQMTAEAAYGSSSMNVSHLGTDIFYGSLGERVIQASSNAGYADEKVAWTLRSSRRDLNADYKASWKLKNDRFWDKNLDFELRTVDLNLTQLHFAIREN
jgi:hypothetical protein